MPTPRLDALETRRLFAFVPTGASTVNGTEFQSIDRTVALDGGGYVSAGIFGKDTDFGLGKLYQPRGESDVFLTLVRKGKTSLLAIGGASSQDLDTDDNRADFAGDPSRVGDEFVFGVDGRIRGADEYVSQMRVGPDGKLYVALLFRRTASLNTNNPRAPRLVAADEFAGNYVDSAILRYDVSGTKLVYERAMQIGGPFNDFIYDFDFDSAGNLVVAGAYERRMDFDPSADVFNQEPDGRGDGFVAKYTPDFELLWVDNFGGDTGDEERPDAVYSIAVDADDAIYAGGSFARTADFDPRPGRSDRLAIRAEAKTDGFTLKLNAGGRLEWVRVQGGDGSDAVKRVTLAPDGVYNVGYFEDGADLHGSPDVKDERDVNDNGDGNTDLFFTRFGANGDQRWVKHLSGDGIELVADAMTAGNGDLVIAGSFHGSTDFDPSSRRAIRTTREVDGEDREDANVGDRDCAYAGFVAVYGSNAKFRRVAQLDGRGDEDAFITGATIAAGGNVSVAGRYRGGFGANGRSIVNSRRDVRDDKEDGYTLVFGNGLTPIV